MPSSTFSLLESLSSDTLLIHVPSSYSLESLKFDNKISSIAPFQINIVRISIALKQSRTALCCKWVSVSEKNERRFSSSLELEASSVAQPTRSCRSQIEILNDAFSLLSSLQFETFCRYLLTDLLWPKGFRIKAFDKCSQIASLCNHRTPMIGVQSLKFIGVRWRI